MYRVGRAATWLLGYVLVASLAGCGGNYSGAVVDADNTQPAAPTPAPSPAPGDDTGTDTAAFFAQRVQPRLDFCRTCHVPEGVADVPEGERFLLDPDPAQDAQLFENSWRQLGGNNPVSRLLTMASGEEEHSGGAPWTTDSQAYADVRAQLRCYGDPDNCADYIAEADAGGSDAQADRKALLWLQAGQLWQGRIGPGCAACHGAPRTQATRLRPALLGCGSQHPALLLPQWSADLCALLSAWVQP